MQLTKLSLRNRIFLAMILLVIAASVLIAAVTNYQYKEQSFDYHTKRLLRKEEAIKKEMIYVFEHSKGLLNVKAIDSILKSKVDEIADIHNSDIHFYNLEGQLIISSKNDEHQLRHPKIPDQLLQNLSETKDHRLVNKIDEDGTEIQALFFYIYDNQNYPAAILHLPYYNNNIDSENELEEFLTRLMGVYIFLFIISIVVAYFISSYITRSLKTVSDKMVKTRLNKRNERIKIKNASKEIYALVDAYNGMIDELEESAVKLAQSEREEAWREMAKQVAHEIKNPLTPMRLTVQSFQKRFNPAQADYQQKLNEFCNSLIEQIDTMTAVASAFSSFAKMPIGKSEPINIVAVIKSALEIFTEDFITYTASKTNITLHFDKTQLIRIITNLIKNAIQASQFVERPQINVSVSQTQKYVFIKVKDNGKGIESQNIAKVFEPKFTTKSSGMGLGLPIVKKIIETYKGTISFQSVYGEGAEFTVTLPKK
jgi:two-component system, NtrC family, nitrogen regulation sensor histidine kinase NtrY